MSRSEYIKILQSWFGVEEFLETREHGRLYDGNSAFLAKRVSCYLEMKYGLWDDERLFTAQRPHRTPWVTCDDDGTGYLFL